MYGPQLALLASPEGQSGRLSTKLRAGLGRPGAGLMLRTRILTALVLLAFLLPAVFASTPWPFAIVSLVLIAAAAWEWARLNGVSSIAAIGPGALLALAGAWAVVSGAVGRMTATWWWATLALWVIGSVFVLRGGPSAWPRWPAPLRLLVGLVLLWVGWLALAQARVVSINFVLSVLCIVWMADVGAYAAGRAFGKHKLAPSISPGKSWEGVFGGLVGVMLLAVAWTLWADRSLPVDAPSLFTQLRSAFGWIGMFAASAALAGLSVVGDLFESLVKRAAGAKDSSRLLPGHGGVLDRIDALMPVLPAAMALGSLA
jgi:phosphatidate cytidylyltransferase